VDAVVEGSIRRDGDRLRVTVELVDVVTGYQIWSGATTARWTTSSRSRTRSRPPSWTRSASTWAPTIGLGAGTDNLRAHDAYLLGLARWHGRTPQDLLRARDYFQEAIAEDEDYALAHAGLALTYAVLPSYTDFPVELAWRRGTPRRPGPWP
jgi:hypothetical protein